MSSDAPAAGLPRRWSLRWITTHVVVTALIGLAGGVAGISVFLLLHLIQVVAFGFPFGTSEEAGDAPSALNRLLALVAAGLLCAVAWWAIRRWAKPVVSISDAVAGRRMPTIATLTNAATQIVAVGLGASIGKEVAPREIGAWLSGIIVRRAGLGAREARILVACGAASGLAAVYDVPLGGALFAVEVLLGEITFSAAIPALATSAIAAFVARIAVPVETLYQVPHMTMSPSLLVWAILVGPVLGLAGVGFVGIAGRVQARAPRGRWILLVMPIAFTIVGVVAIWFPAVLGNGRVLGLVAMNAQLGTGIAALGVILLMFVLAVLKSGTTLLTMGGGAVGGTLSPSIAIGAAAGACLGGLWLLIWPGSGLAAFAFVGAAAFLATTLRAPFTALVLVTEFTGQGEAILIPSLLAVGGSVAVGYILGRRRIAQTS
jgi:H+/Cl- antiporter ClcA